MKPRPLILVAAAAALLAGWYAFRPELHFIDRAVEEEFPGVGGEAAAAAGGTAEPVLLGRGAFTGAAHPTEGTASVYDLPGGERLLRLADFRTDNGPDLVLVLAESRGGSALIEDGTYVELGELKGNVGDQNYALPLDVELERYPMVVVWCRRFDVEFGSARLDPPPSW